MSFAANLPPPREIIRFHVDDISHNNHGKYSPLNLEASSIGEPAKKKHDNAERRLGESK